jgi:hypothetical protein
MPFEINYTDPMTQINYPNSFWLISAVNLNQLALTATVTFDAFATVNSYNVGNGRVAQQQFVFNSAADYQSFLEFQFESPNSIYSFYALIEMAILDPLFSTFFSGGSFIQWSIYRPVTLEVGAEAQTRVNVVYSGNQLTGISAGAGVTITHNAAEFTITGAGLVPTYTDRVYYDLNGSVLPGETIFFAYDPALGFMQDAQLLPLRSFGGFASIPFLHQISVAVTNSVGWRAKFNMAGNSGQIAFLGL